MKQGSFFSSRFFRIVVLLIGISSQTILAAAAESFEGPHPGAESGGASTQYLKKYMYRLGNAFSGLEILRAKEKSTDWEIVQASVQETKEILDTMRKENKELAYQKYLDLLAIKIDEMDKLAKKKNLKTFQTLDQITETCFKCHAAHRPSDFNLPKSLKADQEKTR